MMRAIVAVLFVTIGLMSAPAEAQKLPQYVAGPLSGFAYECQQDKQAFDPRAFVSSTDLDGDGKPDFIFDIAKGCAASKLLYCTEVEGCLIDVFLSSVEMKMAGEKVRAFRFGQSGGRAALLLTMSGTACGKGPSPCERAMTWNGSDLVIR